MQAQIATQMSTARTIAAGAVQLGANGQPQATDGAGLFLQMLMGQMQLAGTTPTTDQAAILQALLGQQQEDQSSEAGGELAAQLLAMNMGAIFPQLLEQGQPQDAAQAAALLAAMQASSVQASPVQTPAQQVATNNPLLQQSVQQAVAQNKAVINPTQQQATPQAAAQNTQELPITAVQPTQQSGESAMEANAKFQSAVSTAKAMIKDAPKSETTKGDISQLEQEVQAGKYALDQMQQLQGSNKAEAAAQTLDKDHLLEALKTNLQTAASKGKDEFIIQLKPEGMGEITVKMVQNAGKIALSIFTANEQTQRLISSELAGLREVLKPLGAEVTQVTSETMSYLGAQQEDQFFQNGQFTSREHHAQAPGDIDYDLDNNPEIQAAAVYNMGGLFNARV